MIRKPAIKSAVVLTALLAVSGSFLVGGRGSSAEDVALAPSAGSTSSTFRHEFPRELETSSDTTSSLIVPAPDATTEATPPSKTPQMSIGVDMPTIGGASGGGAEPPPGSTHDSMPGAGSHPSSDPPADQEDPIGTLNDHGPVPAGLGFMTPPHQGAPTVGHGGPGGLAAAPSCSHQCISKGVAYPRGFGVELLVETTVPARLFITAIADVDGDGDYEDSHAEWTLPGVREHSWPIDHLAPGQTYHVMATATDEHGHTSYVWGTFTTLAQRDVFVVFGDGEVIGGPGNVSQIEWLLGIDGPLKNVTPGDQGILLYNDLPRSIALDFWVVRELEDDLCEVWSQPAAPHGHSWSQCAAWNSTSVAVDLDPVPTDQHRWTETSVRLSLRPPNGAGDALPPGFGEPHYFTFDVPVTLFVTYS